MSLIVPMQDIPEDSLKNLITAFVLREGTDYGELEVSLDTKVAQVKSQLISGQAVIVFSELDESFDIVSKDSLNLMQSQENIED